MVIYIDSVFLLNALLDGLLLYFTGYLAGAERKFYRLLPTAALGGFYAAAVFFPWGVFLGWPPCKLLFGGLLVLLCYGWGECFWRLCLVFFALSCVLAGSVIACGFWMQTQYYVRGAYLLPVQFGLLFCSAALCFGALWLFSRGRLHHAVLGELTEAECEIMGTRVHLRVLRDSGNTLCDPLTGAPVLVAEGTRFASSWPEAARPYLAQPFLERPEEALEALRCVENAPKLRLLPFRSVGTASGLLLGYTAEHVRIGYPAAQTKELVRLMRRASVPRQHDGVKPVALPDGAFLDDIEAAAVKLPAERIRLCHGL